MYFSRSHLYMRHSTHAFLVMELTRVQTHHYASVVKFPLATMHERGILLDSSSYIHNVHRNKNLERY
jgi:hypothetical protein